MTWTLKRWLIIGSGALGALILSFVILRYVDLLLALPLYSWFFERIQSLAGFTDEITGAIAIWLTAAVVLLVPTGLAAVLLDKRKAVLIVALCVSGWFTLSFLFTQPQEGYYFNPMTGSARYKYARRPDGKIELLPLGYRYHPRYGTRLETVTPEIFRAYESQQQGRTGALETSQAVENHAIPQEEKWATVAADPARSPAHQTASEYMKHLELTVEGFGLRGNETVIKLAAHAQPNFDWLGLDSPEDTYFTDDMGTRFDYQRSVPTYSMGAHHYFRLNEVFRFELYFKRLKHLAPYIILKHKQFEAIKVNLKWEH